MGLDGVDGEMDLVGDVLVGRGRRVGRVLERATQRDQHLALTLRERDVGGADADRGRRLGVGVGRRAERHRRLAKHDPVAVLEPAAPVDALAVDVGPIAREAVVDHDPVAANRLDLRVQARDLGVPPERDVALGAPAHGDRPRERVDHLRAAAVTVEQERLAPPLGIEAGLYLSGGAHPWKYHLSGFVLTPRHRQRGYATLGRMRAGLLAAAFVLAAASPAVAAPAQVPCTNIGGGHYECDWYRPGDGFSGGSLVVVGTQTVGYLHQGKNWIICQQVGGDMRNPEGDRNNWFGYTQADNDKFGWASPLDARGGDDYGSFGGG